MSKQRVLEQFYESAELNSQAAALLAQPIAEAVDLMFTALSNGNRIFACGNGGSAADSQHFAAKLIGRFERERLPLPAIALSTDTSVLTAIGNDYGYHEIFAKQVQALGQAGDVLLAISTSGKYTKVPLQKQLPAYITYFTMASDINGEMATFADIYGRDTPVLASLDKPRVRNRSNVVDDEVIVIEDDLQDS